MPFFPASKSPSLFFEDRAVEIHESRLYQVLVELGGNQRNNREPTVRGDGFNAVTGELGIGVGPAVSSGSIQVQGVFLPTS
jgi:hypothetical protein